MLTLGPPGNRNVPDRRARLLIVDDQPEVLRMMLTILREEHDCLTAGSAEEALTLLPDGNVDLLISDIRMNGVSGLELIPRALAASPDTVVIMMSGEETIDNAIGAMRAGAFDYIRKPFDYDHVQAAVRRALDHGALAIAKAHYENHLEELVRQRTTELEHLTFYDSVTGLPNQVLCGDRLAVAIRNAQRGGHRAGVFSISMDQLDTLKDALGHSLADEAFREVARRLSAGLRESDTIGRFEGNEFVVILSAVEKTEDIVDAVHRIRAVFQTPFTLEGLELAVSASIGISLYPDDGLTPAILFRSAHSAMGLAREADENGYRFYAPEMNGAMRRRLSIENSLRRAIARQEFELHYQPQMDMVSGRIVGAEALVRWRGTEGSSVSQEEFIHAAEDSGLIVPVGEWVFRTACEQMTAWRSQGFAGFRLAVNLSARQFRQKDLCATICRTLQETGARPEEFELEMTESCILHDFQSSEAVLRRLKTFGIGIALDDFGTGYSSLSYLKRLPVDRLKIDRSFIRDITLDPDSAALVMTIINLAHNLRLGVIAEGVETAEQLRLLHLLRCDQWQGYLRSNPVPAEQFERLLNDSHAGAESQ
jgi:diguanylate cyclase (GGDEF)-like protein